MFPRGHGQWHDPSADRRLAKGAGGHNLDCRSPAGNLIAARQLAGTAKKIN